MSKKASLDDLLNDMTFRIIYNRLKNLAMNMFVWSGLPDEIKPRYIEKYLFENGKALFFEDKRLGKLVLQANQDGGVNVYNEPISYRAFGYNYEKSVDVDKSVLIRNNELMTNTHDYIVFYANKLTNIERSIDVNVNGQKTPFVIRCEEKERLSFKELYDKIEGNAPVIYGDKNLSLDSIEILPSVAPYVADKLSDLRHDVWNEAMTFLGINNANTDKRERLVTDEVNSNNEMVELNAQYMLESRQKACEEINAMFGTSISVELRKTEGGEEDGTVHSGTKGDSEE